MIQVSASETSHKACLKMALAGYAVILLILLGGILWLGNGHFTYTLDDPYIHLALAQHLPLYTINGLELTDASSSLLYPWLLWPFIPWSYGVFAPLLLNVLAGAGIIALLVRFEQHFDLCPTATAGQRAGLILLLASIINLFTLIFTGMEHTLHMLAALTVLYGLLQQRWTGLFWSALILGPFMRFEALALSLVALPFAFRGGAKWQSAAALAVIVGGMGLHAAYLMALQLPPLPTSVLLKSAVNLHAEGGPLREFLLNLALPSGLLHLALTVLLLDVAASRTRAPALKALALAVAATTGAHLLFGKFGWLERYQAYSVALALLTLLAVHAEKIKAYSAPVKALVLLALCGAGSGSLWLLPQLPLASWQMQVRNGTAYDFVMHEWREPIGATDIGLLAYNNPYPVIDLFGLGSESARQLAKDGWQANELRQFMAIHPADLLIIDRDLFPDWPPEWQQVAELELPLPRLAAGLKVQYVLTNPARRSELESKLRRWQNTLPAQVTLTFN